MLAQDLSNPLEKIKSAPELRVNDEFDAFHDKRFKRCRLMRHPVIEGDRVRLFLAPASQPRRNQIRPVIFSLQAKFELYSEPYRRASQSRDEKLDRVMGEILETIRPSDGYLSAREIQDRLNLSRGKLGGYHKQIVLNACHELARREVLKKGQRAHSLTFALPLSDEINLPVSELAGKKTGRVGWIVAWKEVRGGARMPVCRWLEPGYYATLTNPDFLAPLKNPFQLKQIEIARQKLEQGFRPDPALPESLLLDLYETFRASGSRPIKGNHPALLEIAEILGIESTRGFLDYERRNQAMNYLNLYYPNWQKGGLI